MFPIYIPYISSKPVDDQSLRTSKPGAGRRLRIKICGKQS